MLGSYFYFCVKSFDSYSGKMSDVVKLKKRRAYVRGTITSTLNQLKEMFDSGATASPSESLVLSLVSDLFRQNTYLQNKKHMLTCQGGTGYYRFNYQPGS